MRLIFTNFCRICKNISTRKSWNSSHPRKLDHAKFLAVILVVMLYLLLFVIWGYFIEELYRFVFLSDHLLSTM